MAAMPAPDFGQSSHADRARTDPTRTPRAEFIAITGDDQLLEQIGHALDGQSTIHHAETYAEAQELLTSSQPRVLLLDARGQENLATVLQELHSPDGTNIVIVLVSAEFSAEVAVNIRASAAFAVLPVPLEQTQAAAVFEGAREESLARHALLAPPTTAPSAKPAATLLSDDLLPAAFVPTLWVRPSASLEPQRTGRNWALPAGVALSAILAATLAWYLLHQPVAVDRHDSDIKPTQAAPPAAVPAADAGEATQVVEPEAIHAGSVYELLDSSRVAMRERRYTEPEGDNALNYYRSVLAQEPENGEAREGMQRIAAVLHERVQVAIDENRLDAASRALGQLRLMRIDDPALTQFDAALANARIRWRVELERQQAGSHAKELAGLVSTRIRQGKLLDPSADSAKHYLSELRAMPRDPAGLVDNATAELQQAYLRMLRDATVKAKPAEVERWKSEARALGVKPAELSAVQRDATARAILTENKREGARLAQLVQDRIADGRLLEPAGDSAVFHLNALRAMDPSANAVAKNGQALSERLLGRARSALVEQQIDAARTDAAAARQLGLNLEAVAALEHDIVAAGATSRPEKLVRTRYVAPEYPDAALKQGLRGEVRLRLTVDASGKVKDAFVVQSTPPNVFDRAAIAAARKWRFKPSAAKDSGIETTANASIVFQPEESKQ